MFGFDVRIWYTILWLVQTVFVGTAFGTVFFYGGTDIYSVVLLLALVPTWVILLMLAVVWSQLPAPLQAVIELIRVFLPECAFISVVASASLWARAAYSLALCGAGDVTGCTGALFFVDALGTAWLLCNLEVQAVTFMVASIRRHTRLRRTSSDTSVRTHQRKVLGLLTCSTLLGVLATLYALPMFFNTGVYLICEVICTALLPITVIVGLWLALTTPPCADKPDEPLLHVAMQLPVVLQAILLATRMWVVLLCGGGRSFRCFYEYWVLDLGMLLLNGLLVLLGFGVCVCAVPTLLPARFESKDGQ
jgi:hypothetical protein